MEAVDASESKGATGSGSVPAVVEGSAAQGQGKGLEEALRRRQEAEMAEQNKHWSVGVVPQGKRACIITLPTTHCLDLKFSFVQSMLVNCSLVHSLQMR